MTSAAIGACVAAGLITATATSAPPASAAPVSTSTASAATVCVPTMLIGVHGTGEETGVIGNELANLYGAVIDHTGLPEQGLSGWHDDSTLITDLLGGAATGKLGAAVAKLQTAGRLLPLRPTCTSR